MCNIHIYYTIIHVSDIHVYVYKRNYFPFLHPKAPDCVSPLLGSLQWVPVALRTRTLSPPASTSSSTIPSQAALGEVGDALGLGPGCLAGILCMMSDSGLPLGKCKPCLWKYVPALMYACARTTEQNLLVDRALYGSAHWVIWFKPAYLEPDGCCV